MFERRQRAASALEFSQSQRILRSNEQVPVRPGLIDQILACRAEAQRAQRRNASAADQTPAAAEEADLTD